jgi:hypothetical protein
MHCRKNSQFILEMAVREHRADGCPVTRAKTKEMEKGSKILNADTIKNSCQNSSTQNGAQMGDQACNNGYSTHLDRCDLEQDVAQMALDPLAAIIEATSGPKYKDIEEYLKYKINVKKEVHKKCKQKILDFLGTPKPDFPKEN